MSNLNPPSFQLCAAAVFATFKDTALALALVSTFSVDDVIVKGPRGELASVLFGKFLRFNVICVLPVCDKKSGMNLLIFAKNSPSPPCETSKSPDCMLEVIAVVAVDVT